MNKPRQELVLVTGATGTQGKAVVKAMRSRGYAVRAFVRNPTSAAARDLATLGASLVPGTFEDISSLDAAANGASIVFSVQMPSPADDPDAEVRQGRALVAAARRAGIRQFIHSSALNTADIGVLPEHETSLPGTYWRNKRAVEATVRAAEFAEYTILRPGFFMENFLPPMAAALFPDLRKGKILTAIKLTTYLQLIAADDIATAAVAIVAAPSLFNGVTLELTGDARTPSEIASVLSATLQTNIVAGVQSEAELLTRGHTPKWIKTQERYNIVSRPSRSDMMDRFGLTPTSFARWAKSHAALFEIRDVPS